MSAPKITVVGSNMVDLITYVERMPERGETKVAPRFSMGFGGKGANQAVAASMLGADVRMVTKVGDDMFGPNTINNFIHHGINTDFVETVPGTSSGVAPIFVEPDSSNSILIIKGANERLAPSDIDRAQKMIADSDLVIIQLEVSLETVYHTVELCNRLGVKVLLNPAPADPDLNLERIKTIDFFMPNESELKLLTGMPVGTVEEIEAAARFLQGKGISNIVVTMGDRGALILNESGERVIPPITVASVDSTGAGDAFVGCFAVYYVESGDLDLAIATANRYAALSTTRPGTQSSLFTREEFEKR